MAEPPARGSHWSTSFTRLVPDQLVTPRNPLQSIAVGWLAAFPISMILSALVSSLVPDGSSPEFPFRGLDALFRLVILAPVIETLIMGAVLLLLLRFLRPEIAVAVSAIGWAVAHSFLVPIWGLVIWWPFLVFSILFVTWRQQSMLLAFLIPACVHALQNLLPALLVANGMMP